MASSNLLEEAKCILQHLNGTFRCCSIVSSSGHSKLSHDAETRFFYHLSERNHIDIDIKRESSKFFVSREELLDISLARSPGGLPYGISILDRPYGRSELLPLGVRGLSHCVRMSSTATAKQPVISGEEHVEHQELKQNKEASPEECDEAVEDLSTAKAKAKAKQLQETQKDDQSIIMKFWAKLLGIGPALRAIASMSREDWANKFRHWKNEFVSTMQHYWLGSKLLWADIRICSRLMLKLAGGKSLTRREKATVNSHYC
ncbi:hypothetical protein HPP92_009187 [Vanilla planifolia]|uniref:Uncharacterized protein n=1 Tax=Vanilla planifolia TaxID=51239 RepID=A0A835V570_VANPL|nr:hypothetical protein HPP92_009187 [Vanilla planifolia]